MRGLLVRYGMVALLVCGTGCACASSPHASVPPMTAEPVSHGPVAPETAGSKPLAALPHLKLPSIQKTALTGITLNAAILVVSADGTEADLPAIEQALNYLGTPYTVWTCTSNPGGLTASVLSNGTNGLYQGIILTTAALSYEEADGGYVSALTTDEWTTLETYEADFNVRQVNWYSYPTPDLGFGTTVESFDSTTTPVSATLTTAGQAIFTYINSANPLTITDVWVYLAQPISDPTVTPLLVDASGNALAIEQTSSTGLDWMTLTMDGNPNIVHTLALSYGIINWVTRGLFIGERHNYAAAEVDDLLLTSDIYPSGTYRMSAADLEGALAWQTTLEANPVTAQFRLSFPFNGSGAYQDSTDDPLADELKTLNTSFNFINHTYTHPDFTTLDYATVSEEITQNIAFGSSYGFAPFNPSAMVTPGITGLYNPDAMQALHDSGIQYIPSDTSQPGENNPSPNAGIWNALQPSILEVCRRPTNLYYNVETPDDWTDEYNYFYESYWGTDLTVDQIITVESANLLLYMLRWEADPWMFHQANLGLYDGTESLLQDLLDSAFQQYEAIETTPLVSLTLDQIGQLMQAKMQLNASGVTGVITPGVSITLTTTGEATVPVTGLNTSGAESYAGQYISYVPMAAGQTITIPLQ